MSGDDFDVDRFLARFEIEPEGMFRRGEPIPRRAEVYTQSRFWLPVSDRDFEDFKGQIQDAIAFLSLARWQPVLEAIAQTPGVEHWLCFGISRLDVEEFPLQCDYLPPDLVALAGRYRVGIAIDHYP
ncbi:MAG: hypothetical protein ABIT71_03930 [Vicinamibacteraceae bacterium]